MKNPSAAAAVLISVLVWVFPASGCTALGSEDALGSGSPSADRVTWEQVLNNPYDATFTGCGGDAAVLEGKTVVDGLELAPLCLVTGSFGIVRDGTSFSVEAFRVACSDGSTALISGSGVWTETSVSGQWESALDSGVDGVQVYSGPASGNLLVLDHTRVTFGGAFEGSCSLSPALSASVVVQ